MNTVKFILNIVFIAVVAFYLGVTHINIAERRIEIERPWTMIFFILLIIASWLRK
jgi:hypothetical protein